jgi:DNA ligase 1
MKLYLKDSKGNTRFWEIFLREGPKCWEIHHRYGLIGGKVTEPIPREVCGSDGRKKAITKMNAEIKKKRLLGFQESAKKSVVRGSVFGPMGAHKLDDFAHKLRFPVMVQRKYDGYRCMAKIGADGDITLLSKNMKPFAHLNHIRDRLKEILWGQEILRGQEIYLDGELYSHGLKLNEIARLIMKRRELTPEEEAESHAISFHIFDMIDPQHPDLPFSERFRRLKKILRGPSKIRQTLLIPSVQIVSGEMAKDLDEVYRLNDQYLMEGYEGVIVRNMDGLYQYKKKSYDVLRTKKFKHGEFEIVGGKIGTGSYRSTVIWELKCRGEGAGSHKSFHAIQMGSAGEREGICAEFKKNPGKFVGKMVRVKYLMIDDYGCVLRNPIVEGFVE